MKIFLILPMAVFEIGFLGVCWVVAVCHKPTARRMVERSLRTLPGPEWYSDSQ